MNSIADMTTIIRNGYLARKRSVDLPYSKSKNDIAKKLLEIGFLEALESKDKKTLKILLRYNNNEPAIKGIELISKPSLRVYASSKAIPKVLSGLGEVVISTNKGILTGAEARKMKSGGELILKVW
ncbi:MAG: 30S ribosomal protein S8 [Candidatus Woykebacteria bacterium RBG_13_40_15]|uniref:Small ribosomal subunit protein uS8 n=1 Tax=Candidatus Woykebacteria bacterium RBG_13_40_15 TaxID=1802593 RepID=A0A1G1W926_9BACT|nr:MAG: 30S ribosomal protein S8 [Candidatus Woykebacteria bacterium RBG_13_40_15]